MIPLSRGNLTEKEFGGFRKCLSIRFSPLGHEFLAFESPNAPKLSDCGGTAWLLRGGSFGEQQA